MDAGAHRLVQAQMRQAGEIASLFDSTLQPKRARIAEVPIGEAVQKAEAGDAVKADWYRGNANHSNFLVESEGGQLNRKDISRKSAGVRAAKVDGSIRLAATQHAIVFVQE